MKMKVAQLQMLVHADKEKNLQALDDKLAEIQCNEESMPDLVTLGEMFTCPYVTENFPIYAEEHGGPSWRRLSEIAQKYGIYLAAGSIPIVEDGKVYNAAYVFDRNGEQIAVHRKAHLFDIYLEDGNGYQESKTLTAGNDLCVFDTEFGRFGMFICFDIRFSEMAKIAALSGAKAIIVPGAFNMTTGPAHWELTFRMRAVDSQCYMIGTSDARDSSSGYTSWGHSILVSPWGDVIDQLDEREDYMIHEIDFDYVDRIRRELPILQARRTDLYELKF